MSLVRVSDEVQDALSEGRPIVALESTIISHGLPRPNNLTAARGFEDQIRVAGVTPATVAVLDGVPTVGLSDSQLERIANEDIAKASVRDLPIVMGKGISARPRSRRQPPWRPSWESESSPPADWAVCI